MNIFNIYNFSHEPLGEKKQYISRFLVEFKDDDKIYLFYKEFLSWQNHDFDKVLHTKDAFCQNIEVGVMPPEIRTGMLNELNDYIVHLSSLRDHIYGFYPYNFKDEE